MACSSLVTLLRTCGDAANIAGVDKIYMIAFKDLVSPTTGTTEVYTTAINGIINNIGLASGKTFVEIQTTRSSAGLSQKFTSDLQKGSSFFTDTFSLTLAGLSVENRAFILSILKQPVAVLIKARTGNYFATGLNGQLYAQSIDTGTGTVESDLAGYQIQLSGLSSIPVPLVDATIVSSLI